MTTPTWVLELKQKALGATKGPWYVAGPPWLASDVETYVLSGSPDPHAGEMIFDMPTADMAGVEDKYDETDWSRQNDANAAYIAAAYPARLMALIEVAEAAEKMLQAVEGGFALTVEARAAFDKSAAALKALEELK